MPQVRAGWAAFRPYILRVVWITVAVWLPIMLVYVLRLIFEPEDTQAIVTDMIYAGISPDYETSTGEVISDNFRHMGQMLGAFFGLWLLLASLSSGFYLLWKYPRRAAYLLSSIVLFWGILMLVNARPNSRYFTLVGQLWVVMVAGGVMTMLRDGQRARVVWGRWLGVLPLGLVVLWVGLYAFPYTLQLAADVETVPLPHAEEGGYFANFTGYGFIEALQEAERQPIINSQRDEVVLYLALRLCAYMPYHTRPTQHLYFLCDQSVEDFEADINRYLEDYEAFYIMREDFEPFALNPAALNGELSLIARYQRPYHGSFVELYRINSTNTP